MVDRALASGGIDNVRRQQIETELHALSGSASVPGDRIDITSLDDLVGKTSLSRADIERLRSVLTLRNGSPALDPLVATTAALSTLPGQTGIGVQDYLRARSNTIARADAPKRPPSPAQSFTQISARGTFTIRAEACTSDGRLAIYEEVVRRDAPGRFTYLERREPLEPRFMTSCSPSSRLNS
jgi:hypothetical protein